MRIFIAMRPRRDGLDKVRVARGCHMFRRPHLPAVGAVRAAAVLISARARCRHRGQCVRCAHLRLFRLFAHRRDMKCHVMAAAFGGQGRKGCFAPSSCAACGCSGPVRRSPSRTIFRASYETPHPPMHLAEPRNPRLRRVEERPTRGRWQVCASRPEQLAAPRVLVEGAVSPLPCLQQNRRLRRVRTPGHIRSFVCRSSTGERSEAL